MMPTSFETENDGTALMNMRKATPTPHPHHGSVLSYSQLSYTVKTKDSKKILIDDISLDVKAGHLLAIMGPSGAGKSTLLDLMSFRKRSTADGASVRLNGKPLSASDMRDISVFVEQEDAHIGVLTVRETVSYTLRLRYPKMKRKEVHERVERVLVALGLMSCADQRIGTPISRGISGGQKRRVTAACAMVTYPKILFLDEVTSGLDSTSAREVIAAIRNLARSEGMIVAATIHQPSLETLSHFTDVLFLSQGKVCISTTVDDLGAWFDRFGRPVPRFKAPAEHAMDLLNDDFSSAASGSENRDALISALREFSFKETSRDSKSLTSIGGSYQDDSAGHSKSGVEVKPDLGRAGAVETLWRNSAVLSERTMVNYSRNLLAYGVRAGMYIGMGVMLATIWIRLGLADSTINDRLSVHFFSVAFLAFMSVAGIPEFLEERAVYYRESKNGLYKTLPFVISNTIVNLVFLFPCTVLFAVICYWAVGLHPGPAAFFRFVAFLFLAIVAAESQCLIVAALLPVFIAALAISAFLNGFWMSVGGYFIKARSLPRFWYYSFHFMDYQRYSFELITNSDLRGVNFTCEKTANGCACAYPSSTPDTCTVSGEDVLRYLEIYNISYAKWVGILIGITAIYRIILYVALKTRSQ